MEKELNVITGIVFKNCKAVKNAIYPLQRDSINIDDSGKIIYIGDCTIKGKLKIEIKDTHIVISGGGKTEVIEAD